MTALHKKAETLLKRCADILAYIPEPDRSNQAVHIGYLLAESYFRANKFLEAFKTFDSQVVPVILKQLTFSGFASCPSVGSLECVFNVRIDLPSLQC
jgi:hypothetical protein